MTKLEVRLLAELLEKKLSDRCSDYTLPNTDEHWVVVEGAYSWNVNKTVEQFRADTEDPEWRGRPSGDWIDTSDFLILAYLKKKAISELAASAT